MSKVTQATGKPYIDEIRLIKGVPMVWTGTKWITEKEWDKIYNSPSKC